MLTRSVRRIAAGHYDETIPDTLSQDEIGRLQEHFKQMQLSLRQHVSKQKEITTTLQRHGIQLHEAYECARKADNMKTAFLHNMTNQLMPPTEAMKEDVKLLCSSERSTDPTVINRLVDDVQKQSKTIAELLNSLLDLSENDSRKEEEKAV